MKCPFCDHEELKVTDSRNASEANAIRRRRHCLSCEKRFTTFETVELALQVHKKDGRYEDFQEHKLLNGLIAACRHTRVSPDQVRSLTSKITSQIMDLQTREISTEKIGEIMMEHLKELDNIAYIRFACVYRRFKDIDELVKAIATLNEKDIIKNKSE
ncbi:MAG: Transcriptional repressor NrdR [Chlamydiae bacterium]|nr:Transcriptional repressor NrdR [Chlamydiota bacterium]